MKWLVEKLREAKFEMEVSICEEKQGEVLGEGEEWRSMEDLMNCCDSSKQHEEMWTKVAEEAI